MSFLEQMHQISNEDLRRSSSCAQVAYGCQWYLGLRPVVGIRIKRRAASQAAQHWFGHLQGGLLSHQTLAITALTAFIGVGGADVEGPMAPTLTATVARLMREQGGVAGQAIMAQMAHNHPHHDANEEGSARADMCVIGGIVMPR